MIIFVIIGYKSHLIHCNLNDKIIDIKKKINFRLKLENNNYWLSFNGKVLLDDFKVYNYLYNECNIYLNNRPLDYVKIICGNDVYYADLNMILETNLLPYNFEDLDYLDDKINLIDDSDLIFYVIPNKYLDRNLFNIWKQLFNNSDNKKNLIFEGPISKISVDLIPLNYLNILKSLKYHNILKLSNLLNYLDIEFLSNLINYFIGIIIYENINNLDDIHYFFN